MPSEGTIIKARRRPRARNKDIVIAAIEERLSCIPRDDGNSFHFVRVDELIDELKRSVNGRESEDDNG